MYIVQSGGCEDRVWGQWAECRGTRGIYSVLSNSLSPSLSQTQSDSIKVSIR